MSNRNNNYDEFVERWNGERNSTSAPKHASQRPGRYLPPNRKSVKKRKARQRKLALLTALVIVLLVLIIVLIFKGCTDSKNADADLVGIWHYDQYTEYEFDGKGNGCMCLDSSNHYEFAYKTENGMLYLDFTLEYVTDCQYAYTVNGDKLTLVGGKGTAEIGREYTLTRTDADR